MMTRMTGLDCVVMCNLNNTHTRTHTAGGEHKVYEGWTGNSPRDRGGRFDRGSDGNR